MIARSLNIDVLLEHLNLPCGYYVKDGGGTFCERTWEDTDRECLLTVRCEGRILKCELTVNNVIRMTKLCR